MVCPGRPTLPTVGSVVVGLNRWGPACRPRRADSGRRAPRDSLRSVVTRGVSSREPISVVSAEMGDTDRGRPPLIIASAMYTSGRHIDLVLTWLEDPVTTGPPVSDICVGRVWTWWCPLPGETARGSGNLESATRARVRSCDRAFSTIDVMPLVAEGGVLCGCVVSLVQSGAVRARSCRAWLA
jgi:hypothetical protein